MGGSDCKGRYAASWNGLDGLGLRPIHLRPDIDQTAKRPTLSGWPFCLQINDLPESDVERAMGIEPTASAWEAEVLPLYDARSKGGCELNQTRPVWQQLKANSDKQIRWLADF